MSENYKSGKIRLLSNVLTERDIKILEEDIEEPYWEFEEYFRWINDDEILEGPDYWRQK